MRLFPVQSAILVQCLLRLNNVLLQSYSMLKLERCFFRLVIGTKKGMFIYTLILNPHNTEKELNFKKDFIPTLPMQPDYEPLMAQVSLYLI